LSFESVHTEKDYFTHFSGPVIYYLDSDRYRINAQFSNNPANAGASLDLLQNISLKEKAICCRKKRMDRQYLFSLLINGYVCDIESVPFHSTRQ